MSCEELAINQVLVSFVIPAYNAQAFIAESIVSCLNQTYKNIEVVVVNDGSEDETATVVSRMKDCDNRIILVNIIHSGKVKAINEGIKVAKGDYVAIHAADDVCFEYRIQHELEVLEKEDAVLVFGDMEVVDEKLNTIALSFWRREKIEVKEQIHLEDLLLSNQISGGTILISMEICNKIFPIPETLRFEDWWIGVIASCFGRIANTEKPLIRYRLHTANDNLGSAKISYKDYIVKQKRLIGRNLEYYHQFRLFFSGMVNGQIKTIKDINFILFLIDLGNIYVELSLDSNFYSRLQYIKRIYLQKPRYLERITFLWYLKLITTLLVGDKKYLLKFLVMRVKKLLSQIKHV